MRNHVLSADAASSLPITNTGDRILTGKQPMATFTSETSCSKQLCATCDSYIYNNLVILQCKKKFSRKLHSRSHSVHNRACSVVGNLEENSFTDFSQEGVITTREIRDSEVITSNPNPGSMNNEISIINPNSDEQPNISPRSAARFS